MDYKNFDPDRPSLLPGLRRHLRLLRPLGIVFTLLGVVVPFLTVLRLIPSTYFLNFLAFILMFLGPVLFLVGLAFDGYVDRSE